MTTREEISGNNFAHNDPDPSIHPNPGYVPAFHHIQSVFYPLAYCSPKARMFGRYSARSLPLGFSSMQTEIPSDT